MQLLASHDTTSLGVFEISVVAKHFPLAHG